MCVNSMPRVALVSGAAGIQTSDLLTTSPAAYRYATEPHFALVAWNSTKQVVDLVQNSLIILMSTNSGLSYLAYILYNSYIHYKVFTSLSQLEQKSVT